MLDVRERLASHLYHSVLDVDPDRAPALKISFENVLWWKSPPLWWSVDGQTLVVRPGTGATLTYPLNVTLGELVEQLQDDGIDVDYVNPALSGLSAGILLSATSETSADGQMYGFQSELWALLDAYGTALSEAGVAVDEALKQLLLPTATGDTLDFWGEFFAVARNEGEEDEDFAARIEREVFRPRCSPYAISNAIKDETGFEVTIREPFREIFALDFSALSDDHSFQDGSFYTWNVLQPIYHSNISAADRDRVIAIINRNRPAGCVLLGETSQPPLSFAQADFQFSVLSAITANYSLGWLHYEAGVVSSSLGLSDYNPDLGAPFVWTQSGNVILTFGADPLGLFGTLGWGNSGWSSISWNTGSVSMVVTQHSA